MRPGNRPKGQVERYKHRAGCKRVGEKRNSHVAPGQTFPHDARADNSGEQKRRADRFRSDASSRCHAQQPGAQQLAGFVARMKALINLPCTCGAIASTSTPCPLKKVRASLMSYMRVGSISMLSKPALASLVT